jgi:WD40 repeat protein
MAWISWGLLVLALAGCGSGGTESVREAYDSYRTALAAQDIESLKTMVVAKKAKELDSPQAKVFLEVILAMMPEAPVVQSIEVDGDAATITLDATSNGQMMTGEVTLIKEDGAWKVDEEDWEMTGGMLSGSGNWSSRIIANRRSNKPKSQLTWQGHKDGVTRIVFTRDGSQIVTIGYGDMTLKAWDRWSGRLVDERELSHRPTDLAMMPKGGNVVVVDTYGNVNLWPLDYSGFGEPERLSGDAGQRPKVAVSADGKVLATTAWNKPVQLWSTKEGKITKALGKSDQMRGVAFSPKGKTLVAGGRDNTFSIWELESKSFMGMGSRKTITVPGADKKSDVGSVAFSPDGKKIITGHMDSSVTVWLTKQRKELHNLYVPNASTRQVAFSPDGTLFASAQQDGKVYLWDVESGGQLVGLSGHRGAVTTIAFSPTEGEIIASGGEDGRVVIWQ